MRIRIGKSARQGAAEHYGRKRGRRNPSHGTLCCALGSAEKCRAPHSRKHFAESTLPSNQFYQRENNFFNTSSRL
jgi:hypothetical protein